jgi:hypothetical protein
MVMKGGRSLRYILHKLTILNKDSLIQSIETHGGKYGDISYEGKSHVGILLNLHHIFDGDADVARDIDLF